MGGVGGRGSVEDVHKRCGGDVLSLSPILQPFIDLSLSLSLWCLFVVLFHFQPITEKKQNVHTAENLGAFLSALNTCSILFRQITTTRTVTVPCLLVLLEHVQHLCRNPLPSTPSPSLPVFHSVSFHSLTVQYRPCDMLLCCCPLFQMKMRHGARTFSSP